VRVIADQRRGLMCMDFCEFHPFCMRLGCVWDAFGFVGVPGLGLAEVSEA
jgi:hypothetical protein